ncbi:MAG TPA: hypothetical protein ENK57_03855, partial [Polyangiaceae bacterium]|nr:hypothetical protein [Polyangiaceae bacterium]
MSYVTIEEHRYESKDLEWHTKPKNSRDAARAVFAAASHTEDVSETRLEMIRSAHCMYGDAHVWPGAYELTRPVPLPKRMAHNVLANAIDTIVAKVAGDEPRPMPTPQSGVYDDFRRAELLLSHLDIQFEQQEAADYGPLVCRDSAMFGRGFARAVVDEGRNNVRHERLFSGHVLCDDRACVGTMPRQFFIVYAVEKEHLAAKFDSKAKKEMIRRSAPPRFATFYGTHEDKNIVGVVEALRLSDIDGQPLGRRILAVSDGVLVDREYSRDQPNFASLSLLPPSAGWWPETSLLMRGAPPQLELNKLLRRLQDSMHLNSRPIIFVPEDALDITTEIVNEVGTIVKVPRGANIQQFNPPAMAPDFYAHIDRLVRVIHEAVGVSTFSTQSRMPAAFQSGRAMLAYDRQESERHAPMTARYGRFFVRMAELDIECQRELARKLEDDDEAETHKVLGEEFGVRKAVPWSEVDLGDSCQIQVMKASALPKSIPGRIEILQQWLNAGIIDQRDWLEYSEVPETKRLRDRLLAGRNAVQETVRRLIKGESVRPMPELLRSPQAAVEAIGYAEDQILIEWQKGAGDEALHRVRWWIGEAMAYMRRQKARAGAAAPPAGPPGMPPMGPAGAPPGDM